MSELENAKKLWNAGNGYDAGLLLWQRVDVASSPQWAGHVLEVVMKNTGLGHPLLEEVLRCAANPSEWHDGHKVFDRVRRVVLQLDQRLREQKSLDIEKLNHVLGLAELVAKVTYNASNPPDEFDEDSGAWIVALARGFTNISEDKGFEDDAWNAVASC